MCLYPIISAYKSKIFNKIFICYDSKKYKDIILNQISKLNLDKEKVFFLKDLKKSSTDKSQTEEVLDELLSKIDFEIETCCLIQATSPLLVEKDLIQAYNLYKLKNYDSLLSVSSFKKFVWKKRRNNYFPINYNPKKIYEAKYSFICKRKWSILFF